MNHACPVNCTTAKRNRPANWNSETRRKLQCALVLRDGRRCSFCKRFMRFACEDWYDPRKVSIDHIVPISDGGDYGGLADMSNLRLCCLSCNVTAYSGISPRREIQRAARLRRRVVDFCRPISREELYWNVP